MADANDVAAVERAEGRYCNYFKVGFNAFEFVMDFGQMYEQDTDELMHTRIVTTPAYVKEFARLLASSLSNYEAQYGPVDPRDE